MDGALGKGPAGLGVMAEVDAVVRGFEDEFVEADDFAFAKGCDLERFALAAGFADDAPEGDGSAGGRVFLVGVVALENLARVSVLEGSGGGTGDIEEEVHTQGEIAGVDESGLVLLDQMAHAVEFCIPTCRADDHVFSGTGAGFDVGDDAVWSGEVDDGVDGLELFGSERGAGGVFFGSGDLDEMLPLARNFGDEGSSFASPQEKKVHEEI